MKIAIKKKYVGIVTTFISLVLCFSFLQELLLQISQKDLSILIAPLIFLITTTYSINYWLNLKYKEKLADEVSRQISDGNLTKRDSVKNHLWNKSYEEAYTLNIYMGKIKITSSSSEQNKLEKNYIE